MLLSLIYPKKLFVKCKNMYILAIATHFKDFLRVFYCMKELGLKNTEKKDILPFFSFFMRLSSRYPKKLFVKGKNMYVLAIATHF